MSQPFFISGPSAKIKINNKTIAYCVNVSYSINIPTKAPHVLGQYEIASIEPIAYDVTGQVSVIRYAKGAKNIIKKAPGNASNLGNGIGNWGDNGNITSNLSLSSSAQGRAYDNFDPSTFLVASTFDIEVYQKSIGEELAVTRFRNARFTSLQGQMAANSILVENFAFTAIFADQDSFIARATNLT